MTANRKGLKNQLKSLLWRKGTSSGAAAPGQDSPATPGTPLSSGGGGSDSGDAAIGAPLPASYAAGSVERAMRQLGDLAALLGDYDTTVSTLRLLSSDTKADRAFKAHAGVQEALGVAAVLSGAPPSDAVASFKEAFYRYSQVWSRGVGGGRGGRLSGLKC